MTEGRIPDFEELVGDDVTGAERERLRHVHELIVAAGPPPELSPELEAGPTLAMTLGRQRRERVVRRRVSLLLAATVAVAAVFLGGYVVGNRGGGTPGAHTLQLHGTDAAPAALASLTVQPRDTAGNWPMVLAVTGLPKLPAHGYYEVFLVRNGKPVGPCGTFLVSGKAATRVTLNAPYRLRKGDSWVVTKQLPGAHDPGPVMLEPLT